MAADKENIDWLAVENDYRPNRLSLRAIGEKYGCTEGAIRKKAKKEKWVRNLSEKIKDRADDLVRREAVRASTQNESDIINANALNSATIQITEQKDISRARKLAMLLFDELEQQVINISLFEQLGELLHSPDEKGVDKLNDLYRKTISIGGRVDNVKKLTETLKVAIELERKVHKIDEDGREDTFEGWLKKVRNVQ